MYRAALVGTNGIETEVALKVLRRDLDAGGQAIQRLRDEGMLMARLRHPAILRVMDLVELDGRIALVAEYVDGEDLAGIYQEGGIPRRPLLEILGAIAGALDAAYYETLPDGRPLGLVHRDIKPANIRISRHGEVRLLDFGIARTDSVSREARTATDMLVGSPPYMAPERFLDADIRLASDMFAVGATLYEGLVGQRFFLEQTVTMLAGISVDANRYTTFATRRFAALPADLEPELRQTLEASLAYGPDDRPQPREMARILENLADRAGGPTLTRWATDRVWPEPVLIEGELQNRWFPRNAGQAPGGQEHTSPQPATPPASRPALAPSPLAPPVTPSAIVRPRQWVRVAVMVAALAAVALVITLSLALFGTLGVLFSERGGTEPVPQPTVVSAPIVPIPTPAAVAAVTESPVHEVLPGLTPPSTPPQTPSPVRVAPKSVPSEAPIPASPTRVPAQFRVTGGVRAELRSGTRTINLPGEVPAGSWVLWVQFDPSAGVETTIQERKLEVLDGQSYLVACNARLSVCGVQQ